MNFINANTKGLCLLSVLAMGVVLVASVSMSLSLFQMIVVMPTLFLLAMAVLGYCEYREEAKVDVIEQQYAEQGITKLVTELSPINQPIPYKAASVAAKVQVSEQDAATVDSRIIGGLATVEYSLAVLLKKLSFNRCVFGICRKAT